jgi:hypothetical protein
MLPIKLLEKWFKDRLQWSKLLENAVDARTDIKLIIKDAGKALVQVIDNGLE